MTTATNSRDAFKVVQRLAAELLVLDRSLTDPDDQRWTEFWQLAARFEAVERSARRATKWAGCVFGPAPAHCPAALPVNCLSCAGVLERATPGYVLITESHIETDANEKKWLCETLDI